MNAWASEYKSDRINDWLIGGMYKWSDELLLVDKWMAKLMNKSVNCCLSKSVHSNFC
jgi:hypothetical protein